MMPPLAIAGALAIGLSLGLLGSGGSILTVPVLVYLLGQDSKIAIVSSLGIVAVISLVGAIPYARRREIAWRSLLWFGLPGIAGTWAGAWLSRFMSGTAQLLLFAVVMLLAAAVMLRAERPQRDPPRVRPPLAIAADGLLVGALTGLVGVGGGFLIVPALVQLGGLPMRRAVGTSLLLIALKSTTGFLQYLHMLTAEGKQFDWNVLAIFAAIGIVGSLLGERLGGRLPQPVLRRIFGGLLIVVAAFILWRTLAA